ncbi:hypothetical protein [Chitinophaga rhizosphaerae]|uniref:hypothetical protein n=1 Tax=Chitinophaga rhizosphaerae TaxID=1864947 RepID=UPI000F812BE8|nr:hypothetical protein [Chitinophaga rhizosphaerae]
MAHYYMEHHSDESFLVYREGALLLTVRRRRGWDALLRSEFFLGDKCILAASLSEFLWSWRLRITFLDPAWSIAREGKGVGKFRVPEGLIEVKQGTLRNPVRTFWLNGEKMGFADMDMRKFLPPFEYQLELSGSPELELYFLLAMILSEPDMTT